MEWFYWGIWVNFWENEISGVGTSVTDTFLALGRYIQWYIQMIFDRLFGITIMYSAHMG